MTSYTKIYNLFEQILLPWANRLASNPALVSIRSTLIVTMPFMLLGSLAVLLNSFPLPAYREFMAAQFGPNWRLFGQVVQNGTFSVMSLVMLFSIGQHLADQYNAQKPIVRANPALVGLVSFVCFFCLLRPDADMLSRHWLGVAGLFVALCTGIAAARLFLFFYTFRQLHLRLPGGTAEVIVPQMFNALIPVIGTVLIFACAGTLLEATGYVSLYDIVYKLIRMPFDSLNNGLEQGVAYITSLQLLWFFGIHGSNVLDPVTHDVYGAAVAANEAASAAGLSIPHVMTKPFLDVYVFMGGAGTSLCLTAALLLFGKSQTNRKLGLISLLPGLFNINEVLLFGLPVVLNPLLFIPFVCTPLILSAISYTAVVFGLEPSSGTAVEWTTPVLLNGYLHAGSLHGPFLQVVNLTIGTLLYAPFVLLSNRINALQIQESFRGLLRHATAPPDASGRCTDRHDNVGSLARSLVIDLEYDLRQGHGLHLEFQPQVSAYTSRVTGVEALLRWKHADYGVIPAPITICLAEESGLIRPLGLWVFDTACYTRKHWLESGVDDVIMAVNISALQLHADFPEKVADILRRHAVPSALMEIEVTESGALDEDQPGNVTLSSLHSMGFPLALDDFGMGHSSLKYLKQFPVAAVKLDGAIIRDVVENYTCRDIVASITNLCRARGMVSIAEFVENDEQVAILRSLGCDVFQGYRFSKSLVADSCLQYILANHREQPKST